MHAPALNPTAIASLAGVYKQFGSINALDGLDLQVRPGELVAILGPNGAGKSTAIALLLGLQQPTSGTVTLFGQSPTVVEARRRIGVMMQEVTLAQDMHVRELINLTSSYYADPMPMHEVLDLTQTTALAHRPYGKLSGGQKRLSQFAMALCGRPQLLFLDEPTVGLDVKARERMWFTLREIVKRGTSIVLTTHYLEEAEALADRVIVLAKGRVVSSGTVGETDRLAGIGHGCTGSGQCTVLSDDLSIGPVPDRHAQGTAGGGCDLACFSRASAFAGSARARDDAECDRRIGCAGGVHGDAGHDRREAPCTCRMIWRQSGSPGQIGKP